MRVFILLLFVSVAFSQNLTELIEGGSTLTLEVVSDWRTLTLLIVFINVLLIAFAYMISKFYEMPELSAWLRIETSQTIVTVVILIVAIPFIMLLDGIIYSLVEDTGLVVCSSGEYCLLNVGQTYIDDLINITKDAAEDTLQQNMDTAFLAHLRTGVGCNPVFYPIPCLALSVSFSPFAYLVLDLERYGIEWEWYNIILSSLYAQKFLLEQIVTIVGPLTIFLGIVGRSFFFTRKLGGLLISIGLGLLIGFPLMYLFDWFTLNVTLFGNRILESPSSSCPAECRESPPVAYSSVYSPSHDVTLLTTTAYNSYEEIYEAFGDELTSEEINGVINGSLSDVDVPRGTLYSCSSSCPAECRELPYPFSIPECADEETEEACYNTPEICKVVREYNDPYGECDETDDEGILLCPDECKVIPPLESDCTECIGCPSHCRYTYSDDPSYRLSSCGEIDACNECPSGDAYSSCLYVLPPEDTLENCSGCYYVPNYCTTEPMVLTDCASLCEEELNVYQFSPGEFAKASAEGMYGYSDVINVSKLLIPAFFFPLFNVVVVAMFIRSFSALIGGDVEIPGLSKIL